MITARLATLDELRTIYGPSDLYLLFEIAAVQSHNRAVAAILPNRR